MPSLYGYEVESEFPLKRLNAADGTRGGISVQALSREPAAAALEPIASLDAEDGTPLYASYLDRENCALHMPPSGWFELDPGAAAVGVLREDEDDALLEHRLTSTAACTLLAMRGDLALHASAIAVGGRAVLVCGASWAGKSSLARTLGEEGHEVLAEDGAVIDLEGEPVAQPGPRGIRVRSGPPAEVRVELAPDPGPREPDPCPVGAVILLRERGQSLEVEPLEPARALTRIAETMIHAGSHAAIGESFGRLARLLHTVPGFSASLPDDLPGLPKAAAGLLDATGVRG